jgi:trans-aconitate 2-methyltransferase
MTWDPDRYLTYADERGRPFVELLARVDADHPRTVVDLGCGPGNLTGLLADRWPGADVTGLDSSPEMIAKAQQEAGSVRFDVVDLREWTPAAPVDVLVSNAVLQWVPGHLDLLPGLVESVAPGGWLAFQVPGNFEELSHTIRRDLQSEPEYADHTRGLDRPGSHHPEVYLRVLTDLGCTVDAWETTYLHVLQGEDPVFTWVSSTSARPALDALPPDLRERFAEEFKRRLRAAYPTHDYGVVLPFRRIFVVARVATG